MRLLYKLLGGLVSTGAGTGLFLCKSKNEYLWENVNMPVIQCLDAEMAHVLAVKLASYHLVPTFSTHINDKDLLKTSLWNLSFDSPVGLAAGFDKHAQCMVGMLKMGFGFVEVGSITPLQQPGNPKPRNFRLVEDEAVINRYGFNSYGHDFAKQNMDRYRARTLNLDGVVGVNLGKNKESKDGVADYVKGVLSLGDHADYLVINISSPNTPGLRRMQGREILGALIEEVLKARNTLKRLPPVLVKIAPDLDQRDKEDIASVLLHPETKVDGLIVSNTTVSRPDFLQSRNKAEIGGLSGKPLRNLSTQAVCDMYKLTKGELPIIGVGGIFTGEDAYEKICNGASLVQLYSSLSLHGPPVIGKIKRELAELLRKDGFKNVQDAVGSKVTI